MPRAADGDLAIFLQGEASALPRVFQRRNPLLQQFRIYIFAEHEVRENYGRDALYNPAANDGFPPWRHLIGRHHGNASERQLEGYCS